MGKAENKLEKYYNQIGRMCFYDSTTYSPMVINKKTGNREVPKWYSTDDKTKAIKWLESKKPYNLESGYDFVLFIQTEKYKRV